MRLIMVFKAIQDDIDSIRARDPAARSRWEVLLCYPGFHALAVYRLAHALWRWRVYLLARLVSQFGRLITHIEIHPGARIGKRLFIDHGAGVVIGETTIIGDDVTLYQGVTLGGIAPSVDSLSQVNVKRHPTLGNGVIVGSGAQILGPIEVGDGARVGANAVVSRDVPPGVTAVGIPAQPVMPRDRRTASRFVAYGTPLEGCPDPVHATIENLRAVVVRLQEQISGLEARLAEVENVGGTEAGDGGRRADSAPAASVGEAGCR